MEILYGLLPMIFWIAFIFCAIFVKKVPLNTLIIIDRNTHYLKTKKHGFYFLNPSTDKVTTKISTFPLSKSYSNYFETHDGKIVVVSFSVKYHATNLDDVTYALASTRRSVDDIMESSIYWAVTKLSLADFKNTPIVLSQEAKTNLLSAATELCITIDDFHIAMARELPQSIQPPVFKPHLSSSQSAGPIRFH